MAKKSGNKKSPKAADSKATKSKMVKGKPPKPSSTVKKPRAIKKASAAVVPRAAPVVHRLQNDPNNMLKIEWSDHHNEFMGAPINNQEAAAIAARANPPFCKNKLNDPARKYYCEFDVGANEYVCEEVDANDPRCP